jgi:DNA-binding transcriptional LysR family regulator
MHLVPIACEFMAEYPDIGLRLLLTDRVLRPLEDHIDVSVRIGPFADSSMIAARIGSVRLVACASPKYLEARGHPKELTDLARHECITLDDFAAQRTWRFVKGFRAHTVKTHCQHVGGGRRGGGRRSGHSARHVL